MSFADAFGLFLILSRVISSLLLARDSSIFKSELMWLAASLSDAISRPMTVANSSVEVSGFFAIAKALRRPDELDETSRKSSTSISWR